MFGTQQTRVMPQQPGWGWPIGAMHVLPAQAPGGFDMNAMMNMIMMIVMMGLMVGMMKPMLERVK
ncbi:hypothetical protein M1O12_00360 [Dehalococcoidia bacterium]|nr:hypothetical protein [Dehalococcoidia bacterium]